MGRLRGTTARTRVLAVLLAALLVAAAVSLATGSSGGGITVRQQLVAGTPEGATPVRLDTSLYLPARTPAPAVLLTQGFGGDKSGLDNTARTLAGAGYVVLTYSARGFGRSGGLIHFASPDYEVADARKLVSYLAGLPQVQPGRIAAAGSSYGGGISLLLAASDPRVSAVAADITWNDLGQALFPNFAGAAGSDQPAGAFKKLFAGALFGDAFPSAAALTGSGRGARRAAGSSDVMVGPPGCGRFAADVCAAYQASAQQGSPTPAFRQIADAASPAGVIDRIRVPVLLTQGEQDSLFPLSQADATARALAAQGTPVRVVWRRGGHDTGGGSATGEDLSWFRDVFGHHLGAAAQPWRFSEQAGVVSANTGDATEQTLQAGGYPGVDGTAQHIRVVALSGPAQPIVSPAGGSPTVITSIPGLGGISGRFDQALTVLPSAPQQTAAFTSAPLSGDLLLAGQPTVSLTVTSSTTSAQLFVGLRDLATDGSSTLPEQLVDPVTLTGLTPGQPRTVEVRLPTVVRNVLNGHRLVLTVSSTDFAYANPVEARTYSVAVAGPVTVPTASGTVIGGGHPVYWLVVGLVVLVVVLGAVGAVLIRRRLVLRPDPALTEVPISVDGLVKEYKGGYRAVDGISFRVARGQVVGLLGPNGAGKTTALRVLTGLILPTAGAVHVFGQPVVPGAPVLARIGAFIEGPGFLPHLSGRENLRLFWAATGRPDDEADFDTALQIAGLGASVDRRVRTYSQGMRQRLGIAQAMLGLPELLVLDEPTNGLDPPQIAEMREVLQDYARTGRTVVVSSHLLSEVEQTCTDVVVMHRGRVVAAGSVAEIAGAGGLQLAVPDPAEASRVLAAAGITATAVPARRALEDVFLGLIDDDATADTGAGR